MSIKNSFTVLFLFFLLQACNTSKHARQMDNFDQSSELPETSILSLPIKLYKSDLEYNINQQLGEVLYEDSDFSDGLAIKATRQSGVTLQVANNKVLYKVPIKLWVKKDLLIAAVEAEGSLELEFQTAYQVLPDWELQTTTQLSKYEWTEAPVVKLGIANLNVTSIANQFIDQAKGQIASSIDEQIKNLIDLKSEINRAWDQLQAPILVSPDYDTWLFMNPDSVRLTPLKTVGDTVESTLVMTAKPNLIIGKPNEPASEPAPLPGFQYIKTQPDEIFSLFFVSEIPFGEAEKIAKQTMVGETYTYGKRKVKIEDINIYGLGNRIGVATTLSGSYDGVVDFTGQPEYNDRKNEINLKNVDFEFNTKNKLAKTAGWLFKGSLKKNIQNSLNFHLNENLEAMQKAIGKELEHFQLAPGITILGHLQELNISHVYVSSTSINVRVGLAGQMALEIKDFSGEH